MKAYKYMNEKGLKVMRISASIWALVITVVLLIFIGLNMFKLHWVGNVSVIIGALVLIIFFLLMFLLIMPLYRYKNFRYFIDEDEVHVRRGVIFIDTNIIPYFRIQNIDINEGFIMRKYQLATLTLSTAGGNSEIELIDRDEAQKLKTLIKQCKESDDQLSTSIDNEEKVNGMAKSIDENE